MKKHKSFISILMAVCILLSLLPAVFAENTAEVKNFEGRSWDEIIEQFLSEHGYKENSSYTTVGLGYLNLVTGEEHYFEGDEYMVAGSMFKVPLNMLFTGRIAAGEMSFDTVISGQPYSKILEWTIVNSDNDWAKHLWETYPSYHAYREAIAPLCGEDPVTVDEMFYKNNYFTSRQIITCLKELYENSQNYPRLIDTMKIYAKNNMFVADDPDLEIAQKYGYLNTDYHFYLTNCGIVYTEEPIALVIFTDNTSKPYALIEDYCKLMIDYARYSTEVRREQVTAEAEAAAIATLEREAEKLSANTVDTASEPVTPDAGNIDPENVEFSSSSTGASSSGGLGIIGLIIISILTAVLLVAVIVMIFTRPEGIKLNTPWAIAAAVLAAAAIIICPLASVTGPVYVSIPAEPSPKTVVTEFFDSVCDNRWSDAYSYLNNYSGLGLEKSPATESAQAAYNELTGSYSYKLYGEASVNKTTAVQQVLFTYLDITALNKDLPDETSRAAGKLSDTLPATQVFDDDGAYLDSFLEIVNLTAMNTLLERSWQYYNTVGLTLELEYSRDGWLITGSTELLNALCGGTAY